MRINCVIVNYNDADTVTALINRISGFQILEQIVVVDNASSQDSWQTLKLLESPRVCVIRAEKNGGYGYGNNLGVRYAVETNHATHVVIANPDVEFAEHAILALARIFKGHPDVGVAAPVMEDMQYGGLGRGWRLHGFAGELLAMGPVSRRIFGGFLNYRNSYYQGKRAVYVDAVHGSMLMVDARAFLECGGYDERMFLYQEEEALAWRMRTGGRRTVLLLEETYVHRHGASISKSFQSQWNRQKLRHESVMHYMKQYLFINRLEEWIARAWFWGIFMEIGLAEGAKRISGAVRSGRSAVYSMGSETWKMLQADKKGKNDGKIGEAGAGDEVVDAASGRVHRDVKAHLGQRMADQHGGLP